MNKIIKFITTTYFLITIYLKFSLKTREFEILLKKKLNNFIICTIIVFIISISIWFSMQMLIFFWLLSLNSSYIHISLFIISLNLIILLIFMVCFKLIKKRSSKLDNNYNLNTILNYIIKTLEKYKT